MVYNVKSTPLIKALIAAIIVSSSGCTYEEPETTPPVNQEVLGADMSNVIFIGGSLFSGVADGSLTNKNSLFSIPQIFLNTLDMDETIDNYSVISANQIGHNIYENNDLNGSIGPYQLTFPIGADTTFFQKAVDGEPFTFDRANENIQNFSFPKTQILDVTETNRSENEFINTFYNNTMGSLLDRIISDSPSFFVLDLGLEDLIGFAINGAEGQLDASNATHTYDDLLDVNLFEQKLEETINQLTASGSDIKGVVLNIPDFLKYPYFLKVSHEMSEFLSENRWLQLIRDIIPFNEKLDQFYQNNPGIPFANRRKRLNYGTPFEDLQPAGWIAQDNDLAEVIHNGEIIPKVRHTIINELIFYKNESYLVNSRGTLPNNALTENQYLKESEIVNIRNRISSYNAAIQNVVSRSTGEVILFDLHQYFEELFQGLDTFLDVPAEGKKIDGVPFLPVISQYGIFSADGLNLNPRGNALITNQLIGLVNRNFNGNLKLIDPNHYAGTPIIGEGR